MKKMMFLSKNWYFSVQKALIYYTVNKSHHNSFILLVFSPVANFRYVANFRFLTLIGHINLKKYNYVISGIGFGLMYLPSIVIVGYYFDKKRAFATGLAVCGSGIGTFLFAPLGMLLNKINSLYFVLPLQYTTKHHVFACTKV